LRDAEGIRSAIASIRAVRAFVATGTSTFDGYFADRLSIMETELASLDP